MATEAKITELEAAFTEFESIDRDKLLRKTIGDESLSNELQPILDDLDTKCKFARNHANGTADQMLEIIRSAYSNIASVLQAQQERANPDYIANKPGLLNDMEVHTELLLSAWPSLVSAAVLARGFLQDEGVHQEYENTVAKMKQESSEAIQDMKNESEEVLKQARSLAEGIEASARKTAAGISVAAAQAQFKEAQEGFIVQIILWAVLSVISLAFLAYLICEFMDTTNITGLSEDWSWKVAYFSAIRVTALGAVATFTTYCMRIFRAQLHMYQYNLHRQRVTNSMEAFVEAAATPEQRDIILAKLVDSVIFFGNSGLLHEDGSDSTGPKLTVENISRTLGGAAKDISK